MKNYKVKENSRKITVEDSNFEKHVFRGNKDLKFFTDGNVCRIYIDGEREGIAAFCNFISVSVEDK